MSKNKSNWKTIANLLVQNGLPLLGGAVGAAPGAALGGLIAKVIGGHPDKPQAFLKTVETALSNPEAVKQLKELEYRHEIRLEEIVLEKARLDQRDRQSARDREVEITKATGSRDKGLYNLAAVVVVGFLGSILALALVDEPFTNNEAALLLIGALATGFGTVLNYFFGSSDGSKKKTAALTLALSPKVEGSGSDD